MAADDPHASYEALVHAHGADLYRIAYRMSGEAGMAEDLVQETYYEAWRSIGRLRDPDAGRAWLLTILRRRWAHLLRDRSRRPRFSIDEDAVASALSRLPGPGGGLFGDQEAIQGALDRLEPWMREPFLLVFLEGLTCREAAERLEIPRGTVLSRIHRARQRLRADLTRSRRSEERAAGSDAAEGEGA